MTPIVMCNDRSRFWTSVPGGFAGIESAYCNTRRLAHHVRNEMESAFSAGGRAYDMWLDPTRAQRMNLLAKKNITAPVLHLLAILLR